MRVLTKEAQFTPEEAAKFTGVSQSLQRDWRRRGVLPAKRGSRHTRFGFGDLCELAALKAFSDAGFGPKSSIKGQVDGDFRDAKSAASICLLPMAAYAGANVASDDGPIGRYVIIDGEGTCRTAKLSGYEAMVAAGKRVPGSVFVVFDCKAATERLLGAIGRSVFTTTTVARRD